MLRSVGFSASNKDQADKARENTLRAALKKVFNPEFLNRIDEVVVFNDLEQEQITQIIELQLKGVFGRIREKGFEIQLTDAAKLFIAEKGFDKQYGARPLKRALQRYLEDPVAEEILNWKGAVGNGETVIVDYEKGADDVKVHIQAIETQNT